MAPPSSPVAPATRIVFLLVTVFLPKGFLIGESPDSFVSSSLKSLSSMVRMQRIHTCFVNEKCKELRALSHLLRRDASDLAKDPPILKV